MGSIFSSCSRVSKKERKNMLCNGGLLLEELLHSCDGKYNPFRIFSAQELAEATGNYQELYDFADFCTIYTGFLNGRPIYVKYPRENGLFKKHTIIEMAINEVVFASQVNGHKNIHMLLGCCLETEFPALVYEYAENGTLSCQIGAESIHNHRQLLPWNDRLKVAKEIADALAYLHTGLSTPIIHRCIKPRNIFLDGNYVAKLTEFSLSVSIPLGEEYLETCVMGTTGFVAPEYGATGKLTDKSDVYLFGALLIEILSGERYQNFLREMKQSKSNSVSSGACNLVNGVEGRDCDGVASNQREIGLISTHNLLEVHGSDDQEASNVLNVNDRDANSTSSDDIAAHSTSPDQRHIFSEMEENIFQAIVVAAEKYIGPENMLESHLKQLMALAELAFRCLKVSAQERPTMKEVAQELRRIITFQQVSPLP